MALDCIIIEDDPAYREYIISLAEKIPFLNISGRFANATEAAAHLVERDVDLIISDIEMGEVSGIEFIRSLKNPPQVIFLTSFPGYAIEGFDVNAIDYLVKPVTSGRLLKAVNKAYEQIKLLKGYASEKAADHMFVRTDAQYVKLKYDDIVYIEAYGDFVKIYTSLSPVIALVNLKNIEEQLPQNVFMRIHRSYIVNVSKIISLDNSQIKTTHYQLPVGKAYRDKIYASVIGSRLVKRFNDESEGT